MLIPLNVAGSVNKSAVLKVNMRGLSLLVKKMEVLRGEEVKMILYLQGSFRTWTNEMLFLSRLGDPRNCFLVYFPVAYHLNGAVGLMVLWIALLSEWTNLVLKWLLRGERPYWWIYESSQWKDVKISQYSLTCETGPGSPSGHAMVTTSVLFTLMPFITRQLCCFLQVSSHSFSRNIVQVFAWLLFAVVITLVSISRVFIATHFPHQVILGVAVGIALSYITQKQFQASNFTRFIQCTVVSLILVSLALVFYFILSLAIFDPSVSVQKAQKWCVDPEYVHLDTTPFYSLVRDTGAVFGIGVAHSLLNTFASNTSTRPSSPQNSPSKIDHNNILPKLLSRCLIEIILSVSLLQFLEYFSLPQWNKAVFYIAGYFKNVLVVVIVICVVPLFTGTRTIKESTKPKSQ